MLVLVGGMLHAVEFTIDRMPVSHFVDTEVSANMAIGVGRLGVKCLCVRRACL